MERRRVLGWLGALALWGCAGPKAPLKPNAVQRIGMLPVKQLPARGSVAPFNESSFVEPVRNFIEQPSALGNAILSGLIAREKAAHAERRVLTSALSFINIYPRQVLVQSLSRHIEARSLPISELNDSALAESIRSRKIVAMPQDVQALLDIQIVEAGYYASEKAGGFTPYFNVSSMLWDTVNPNHRIAAFGYSGDFRDSGGNTRFFTTPKELSSPDLDTFRSNPERFRPGLLRMFDNVAKKLLDDVQQVLEKQRGLM